MSLSQRDQELANLRDGLPRVWWALYQGSRAAGFTEAQAFALTTTFILSSNPHGIRPDARLRTRAEDAGRGPPKEDT